MGSQLTQCTFGVCFCLRTCMIHALAGVGMICPVMTISPKNTCNYRGGGRRGGFHRVYFAQWPKKGAGNFARFQNFHPQRGCITSISIPAPKHTCLLVAVLKPDKNTRHRPFWRVAGWSIRQVCCLVFFGVLWCFFGVFWLFFGYLLCSFAPKGIFSMVCWGLGGG